MARNKAEREGKQHRAEGKDKSSGKYNKTFPSKSDRRNKADFDRAYDKEDKERREKSKSKN